MSIPYLIWCSSNHAGHLAWRTGCIHIALEWCHLVLGLDDALFWWPCWGLLGLEKLNLPFGFSPITKGLTQSEWPSTSAVMPCLTILSSYFSSLFCNDKQSCMVHAPQVWHFYQCWCDLQNPWTYQHLRSTLGISLSAKLTFNWVALVYVTVRVEVLITAACLLLCYRGMDFNIHPDICDIIYFWL